VTCCLLRSVHCTCTACAVAMMAYGMAYLPVLCRPASVTNTEHVVLPRLGTISRKKDPPNCHIQPKLENLVAELNYCS
jgi:hypothetical protein